MLLEIDKDVRNADWTKQSWDMFHIKNKYDLYMWLQSNNMTLKHFKTLPVYQFNKNKIRWLREI